MGDPRLRAAVPLGAAWTFSLAGWDGSRQLLGEPEVGAQSTSSCQTWEWECWGGASHTISISLGNVLHPHPALGSTPAGFKGMVQREDPQPTQSFQGVVLDAASGLFQWLQSCFVMQ